MEEPLAYFDGRWIPASQAAISPMDAGFVQGSTVAEQLRTFGGKIFRLAEHLARLRHSLSIIGVDAGMDQEELARIASELVQHNHRLLEDGDDLGLSIFVTPGQYPSYLAEAARSRPLVCLHTYPLPFRLWAEKYRSGQALRTTAIRQVPACCWPPELKCRSRMHYHLADSQAAAAEPGARALLLDEHDRVSETSSANLLIYTAGVAAGANRVAPVSPGGHTGLASPPPGSVLPGISLAEVKQLAAGLGVEFLDRQLALGDVAAADEVFLSSTPFCLIPVTRLDGRPIAGGVPGPIFARLIAAWNRQAGLDIPAQARRFSKRP
jgi:branched-subunit amino acid aminotransferase/4-amino-4-deoxychorismate lyase